jgi:homocysteine S-methyltransferase
MSTLADRLARREVIILDGATGTELDRRGVPMNDVAWSGAAAMAHADTLRQVHADYIRAGADIVITNTFATMRYLLEAAGLGDQVRAINEAAVTAARAARDDAAGGREVWIAGSISSTVLELAPDERPSLETATASFREQAEILAEGGVDLIILEMMRDVDYTGAAIDAAAATGLPVWVGFSCVTSAAGEIVMVPGIVDELPFRDVVGPAMRHGGSLVAVMHTELKDATPALAIARETWSGPLGAYPHSGRFVMPHWRFERIVSPEAYLEAAQAWVAMGVQVIGGCCGIGPDHIRLLAERLPKTLT